MANVNPGPASTSTPSILATLAPTVTPNYGNIGQATNAIRLLAEARAVPILGTGDIAAMPLINTQSFFITALVFTNALLNGVSASAAALTVSANGGPGVTGISIKASAALTTLTGQTAFVLATVVPVISLQSATMGTGGLGSNYIYINATVASAAANTMDVFMYGYDIT